jgi:hypothetical protein
LNYILKKNHNNNKYINSLLNSFILLGDKILMVLNNIKEYYLYNKDIFYVTKNNLRKSKNNNI